MSAEPLPPPVILAEVRIGRAVPYTRPGSRSGIAKLPQSAPGRGGVNGLEGDEQGDLRVHGGPDKAIHHYPFDHYADWQAELGPHRLLQAAGAFGENFSARGWTESDLCLGDVVSVGTALLEVSQGRQPCWKLSDRFAVADMALRVQRSGRTGWYYRVLRPGVVSAGDCLAILQRPYPAWSLQRLMAVLHDRRLEEALLRECMSLPLVPSWQRLLQRRLELRSAEDWSPRLDGPALEASADGR